MHDSIKKTHGMKENVCDIFVLLMGRNLYVYNPVETKKHEDHVSKTPMLCKYQWHIHPLDKKCVIAVYVHTVSSLVHSSYK